MVESKEFVASEGTLESAFKYDNKRRGSKVIVPTVNNYIKVQLNFVGEHIPLPKATQNIGRTITSTGKVVQHKDTVSEVNSESSGLYSDED